MNIGDLLISKNEVFAKIIAFKNDKSIITIIFLNGRSGWKIHEKSKDCNNQIIKSEYIGKQGWHYSTLDILRLYKIISKNEIKGKRKKLNI